jgi:uncharacterized membrane protein
MTRLIDRTRLRKGLALAVASALVNPWVVGLVATDDGSIGQPTGFSVLLFLALLFLLGSLQFFFRWVDRISWSGSPGLIQTAAVVILASLAVAGTYWRVATYQRGHSHTTLVEVGHHSVTAEQQQWAAEFYARSLAAAKKHGWFDINNAFAQGFQVDGINADHYPNQAYMFDDVLLDPERPEWLVYDDSPNGKVLMALMFFTRTLEEVGPTPAGPLAQWHYHPYDDVRCAIKGLWTVGKADDNGQCAEGVPVTRTPEMLHVWFMDHPLGHFTEMNIVPDYRSDDRFDIARLHPMTVHFAIALFVVAVLFDVVALITRKAQFHWAAWINLILAAVAVATAVAAGMTAEVALRPTHEAHQTLDSHKLFAYSGLGIVLLLTAWRYFCRGNLPRRAVLLYGVMTLAGLGAIGGAGFYGGELVYTHGGNVRAVDSFLRDRYFRQVQEVYREEPAGMIDHSSHR